MTRSLGLGLGLEGLGFDSAFRVFWSLGFGEVWGGLVCGASCQRALAEANSGSGISSRGDHKKRLGCIGPMGSGFVATGGDSDIQLFKTPRGCRVGS